jgi:hypothetical protein
VCSSDLGDDKFITDTAAVRIEREVAEEDAKSSKKTKK